MKDLMTTLSPEDYASLRSACRNLEHPSLAARLTSVVGTPIEMGLRLLPRSWYKRLREGAEAGIARALDVAVSTLHHEPAVSAHEPLYKLMGITTGALGGFFGGAALLVELPITTTIMLRAIADIARREGENLDTVEARLACMEVFALGGRSEEDDAADIGYYGIRLAIEVPVMNAARYISQYGLSRQGAPALVNLLLTLSERFGFSLTEKAAAQIVPCIGAAGGALVNIIFIQHFQDVARGHFTVRRLERKYGPRLIEAEYAKIEAEIC